MAIAGSYQLAIKMMVLKKSRPMIHSQVLIGGADRMVCAITAAISRRSSIAAKSAAMFLFCTVLTGCYTTDQEVVTASLAESLPYKSDRVSLQADGDIFLTRSSFNHDYAFRQTKPDDTSVRTGIIRVIRVKANIFAVQLKYDDDKGYDILFSRISANGFGLMEPKSNKAVAAVAKRYNVHLTSDLKKGTDLAGDPSNIFKFLKALKDVEFQTPKE